MQHDDSMSDTSSSQGAGPRHIYDHAQHDHSTTGQARSPAAWKMVGGRQQQSWFVVQHWCRQRLLISRWLMCRTISLLLLLVLMS